MIRSRRGKGIRNDDAQPLTRPTRNSDVYGTVGSMFAGIGQTLLDDAVGVPAHCRRQTVEGVRLLVNSHLLPTKPGLVDELRKVGDGRLWLIG